MQRTFRRLAIVNRGEPAMRVIHAVRELNAERPDPIRLIALYTDPDRQAMFVRHADEAFGLGSPLFVDPVEGGHKSRYLDYQALERALVAAEADAAWVGWGFVAEHPQFAELCERLGIGFVGPDAAVMRRLGDKIHAKQLAEESDVPVAPWSGGPVETIEEAVEHAQRIGFPLMVKATAGGGGRGIRRANHPDELATAFEHARSEARATFGDPTVLLEQVITPARHIEVQIIADGEGGAWAAGVRDCSYQRHNQKVVEESSSPALTPEQEREIADAALRLVHRAGYRNAGTVEFLYEPMERRFSFMEVNARLQVEHPVTEMTTGLDLVKLQLHVAAGGRLEGEPPPVNGHAVEVRLNAEDPALGFAATPGRVELLRLPTGPGLRIDTGVVQGDVIPAEFDSMIAKLIAWGRDRPEALARLQRALADTVVVLDDGTTNQGFLLELIRRPEVQTGEVDTGWLDLLQGRGETESARYADVALLQAAIELADAETAIDRARFYAFARRGRPQATKDVGRTIDLRYRGQSYRFRVAEVGRGHYEIDIDDQHVEVEVERLDPYERRLTYGRNVFRTVSSTQDVQLLVEVNGVPHRISRDDRGLVRSFAPAIVAAIPVAPGDEVAAGDVVAVVESMKMESSLCAPFHGRVRQVLTTANVQVGPHTPLVQIEPLEAEEAEGGERVAFTLPPEARAELTSRCRHNLQQLEWLVLGYDVTDAQARRQVAELLRECSDLLGCDPALVPGEHRLLDRYATLRSLMRPAFDADDPESELVRSPEEYLYSYLRSLDIEAEGLPLGFVDMLQHALSFYGVEGLDRTAALEDAGYRIFLAHQRSATARAAVTAILEHRMDQAASLVGNVGEEFRDVLDRLITALERRDPALADLARAVRYRYYDEPVIEAAREESYAAAERDLEALAADPDAPDVEQRIQALVDCPQPLAPQLTARILDAGPALQRRLLEVMTRRYYRVRDLTPPQWTDVDGRSFLTSRYDRAGVTQHVAVAFIALDDLPAVGRALAALAERVPEGDDVVADLFAAHTGERPDADVLSDAVRARLDAADLPPAVRRLGLAVAEPGGGRGMSAVDLLTFRRTDEGLREDRSLRGLHAMMGHRLELWRMANFELERLPSLEDVYLFRGVGRSNPEDQRLFGLAEVRDMTAVRDADGRLVSVPELERMLIETLEAMRSHLATLPARQRPLWNRVLLYVWPTIELDAEEIRALQTRFAPASAGLGIESTLVRGRLREADGSERERLLRFFSPAGKGVTVQVTDPPEHPLQPLDEGTRRIVSARRRGTVHPAEIVRMLAPPPGSGAGAEQPSGEFVEHDLDEAGQLVPVDRPPATNKAGVVVGLIRNFSDRYPEGMLRVILLGDPTKALGSLAEPECRRIMAALDLADELGVPVEWFAHSAGAKIAMDSGSETMDWISAVLRRIIEFTQGGGEINVVVSGINVGAQPYFNAEATMLMHTNGILVMTPDSAMVLTGKQSLDYAGGVSAEDNFGIGGYERVMGPNGQAQYWAPDLAGGCRVLLGHYEHAYVAPGERFPRRAETDDPIERDVRDAPHTAPGTDLATVGDIFSDETNPARKKAFDIRSVMRAVIDSDHAPLERWGGMRDAEIAVVWDAHLGGWPVAMIGIESRPMARYGEVPADGPEQWTSGTLFPRASKKIARAINAATGVRPLVVLANLAGFDGSPESMREWQLEFGAEIGRAVTNFDGPIVFCVVSRYHGGAFVVFSQRLNEDLETFAVAGARVSVIGGFSAAAVVFARDVDVRTREDPRIKALDERIATADGVDRQRLRAQRQALWTDVHSEKLGEMADEFDAVHSVQRAVEVGSVTRIIPAAEMRPLLVEAVERGMRRIVERLPATDGRPDRLADPLAG